MPPSLLGHISKGSRLECGEARLLGLGAHTPDLGPLAAPALSASRHVVLSVGGVRLEAYPVTGSCSRHPLLGSHGSWRLLASLLPTQDQWPPGKARPEETITLEERPAHSGAEV